MNGEKKQQTAVFLRRQVQCGKYWCTGLEVLGMKRLQRFFLWISSCPSSRGVTTFHPTVCFRGHAALEDIQTGQDPPEQPESLHFYPRRKSFEACLLGGKTLHSCAPQQEGQFLFCLQSCAAVQKDLKLSTVLQGKNIDFFLFYPAKPVKSTIYFFLSFFLCNFQSNITYLE